MARDTLPRTTLPGSYPTTPLTANIADLVETAAHVGDGNQIIPSGKDIIIAHNTGIAAHTVTINSVIDENKRTGTITTYSVGAGEIAVFGPMILDGWRQADGYIYLEADHADVKFGVFSV